MTPFELDTPMYSNRHFWVGEENLIKHLHLHRGHRGCVRDSNQDFKSRLMMAEKIMRDCCGQVKKLQLQKQFA